MSLRKRGNTYHARVYDKQTGELHEFSTGETKKSLAAQEEARFRRDLAQNRERAIMGLKGGKKISEVLDAYLDEVTPSKRPGTQRREKGIIGEARTFFVERGDPDIGKVKAKDFASFLDWKAGKGVKARTVNLYRAVLRHVMAHAMKVWDLVDANPLDKVPVRKEAPRQARILTEDELEKLLAAAKKRPMLHLFILFLAETGARSESEALKLQWSDIDFGERFIHIRSDGEQQTKTGKSRFIPMSRRLVSALKDHAAKYRLSVGSPWVFCHLTARPGRKGGAKKGDRIEKLYRGFRKACEDAEIGTNIRPHDLRHTFATHKVGEGRNIVALQKVLGHANLQTTMKYTHLVREDLRSVVEPLEESRAAN